jgi:hypothetical protein
MLKRTENMKKIFYAALTCIFLVSLPQTYVCAAGNTVRNTAGKTAVRQRVKRQQPAVKEETSQPEQNNAAVHGEKIGVAASVSGTVFSGAGKTRRTIRSGSDIFLNERIRTGKTGSLQIMLLDETVFTLGPDSDMVMDEFVYNPANNDGKVYANVAKGVFRFITGKIARKDPEKMNVKITAGNIGIRGTIVAGKTGPDGSTVILAGPGVKNNSRERAGAIFVTGGSRPWYDKTGKTPVNGRYINVPGYGTTVSPNGVVSAPRKMAAELNELNKILAAGPRISMKKGEADGGTEDGVAPEEAPVTTTSGQRAVETQEEASGQKEQDTRIEDVNVNSTEYSLTDKFRKYIPLSMNELKNLAGGRNTTATYSKYNIPIKGTVIYAGSTVSGVPHNISGYENNETAGFVASFKAKMDFSDSDAMELTDMSIGFYQSGRTLTYSSASHETRITEYSKKSDRTIFVTTEEYGDVNIASVKFSETDLATDSTIAKIDGSAKFSTANLPAFPDMILDLSVENIIVMSTGNPVLLTGTFNTSSISSELPAEELFAMNSSGDDIVRLNSMQQKKADYTATGVWYMSDGNINKKYNADFRTTVNFLESTFSNTEVNLRYEDNSYTYRNENTFNYIRAETQTPPYYESSGYDSTRYLENRFVIKDIEAVENPVPDIYHPGNKIAAEGYFTDSSLNVPSINVILHPQDNDQIAYYNYSDVLTGNGSNVQSGAVPMSQEKFNTWATSWIPQNTPDGAVTYNTHYLFPESSELEDFYGSLVLSKSNAGPSNIQLTGNFNITPKGSEDNFIASWSGISITGPVTNITDITVAGPGNTQQPGGPVTDNPYNSSSATVSLLELMQSGNPGILTDLIIGQNGNTLLHAKVYSQEGN